MAGPLALGLNSAKMNGSITIIHCSAYSLLAIGVQLLLMRLLTRYCCSRSLTPRTHDTGCSVHELSKSFFSYTVTLSKLSKLHAF